MENGEYQRVPLGRWLTILVGTLCTLMPWVSVPGLSAVISLVLSALLLGICLSLRRGGSLRSPRPLLWLMAIVPLAGGLGMTVLLVAQGGPVLVLALVAAVVVVMGAGAVLSPSVPRTAVLVALGALQVGLIAAGILTWSGHIDVELFVKGGLDALANGRSPYAITIDNPYPPHLTELFYGPGVVEDGRVIYGFPYLPAPLLLDLPMYLVADALWMHLLVLAAAVVLAWRMATDQLGRAAVLVVGLNPSTPFLIMNYWVEALLIGLVTLTAWGLLHRRPWATVVGAGLLFSSKQYAVFFLPALWPVSRRAGWRVLLSAATLGAVVMAAFVLMDPLSFYRSVVELQFRQPFRDDAISLLPGLQALVGELPRWALGVLPFAGLTVSAFIAMRTNPGPTAFCLCVGLGLLGSVLVSKVGFVNYYVFIGAALLLGGVTWPVNDPVRESARDEQVPTEPSGTPQGVGPAQIREPSSQGSRGDLGISSTR